MKKSSRDRDSVCIRFGTIEVIIPPKAIVPVLILAALLFPLVSLYLLKD